MIYSILGTGAIGGYYGSLLARSGRQVNFLLHSDYEHVREHGLLVKSVRGDFSLPHVNAFSSADQMPKSDIVIVALKTTRQALLREMLPPLLKSDTLVLLIQNGIGVEADVEAMIPSVHLAAGLAFICASKTEPGIVRHMDFGALTIAPFHGDEPHIEALMADLAEAGVEVHLADYQTGRWQKAMWNMPFNGLTVALHCQTDQLLRHPSTEALVHDMMGEVLAAAKAWGVTRLSEENINTLMEMTRAMTPYKPSMRLDWDFHRPMEIEFIYSRPIEEAAKKGVAMPRLQMLERQLLFLQNNNL